MDESKSCVKIPAVPIRPLHLGVTSSNNNDEGDCLVLAMGVVYGFTGKRAAAIRMFFKHPAPSTYFILMNRYDAAHNVFYGFQPYVPGLFYEFSRSTCVFKTQWRKDVLALRSVTRLWRRRMMRKALAACMMHWSREPWIADMGRSSDVLRMVVSRAFPTACVDHMRQANRVK